VYLVVVLNADPWGKSTKIKSIDIGEKWLIKNVNIFFVRFEVFSKNRLKYKMSAEVLRQRFLLKIRLKTRTS
jgi:hypothetical protein